MNIFFTVVIIGAIYVAVRRPHVTQTTRQPRPGEAYYYQVRKEMGIDPYSSAELAQMDAEERYTHDRNAHAAAALSEVWDATWIDSYGNVREL